MIVYKKHDGPFHFHGHGLFRGDGSGFVFFWWYDYLLLIVIFPLVDSRGTGECVWRDVFLAWDMSYFVVIFL